MAGSPKREKRRQSNPESLLSPQGMGGINAGKGFDFQTRYAVCHLPEWLDHGAFHQLFFEGTGDIDVRFVENSKSTRVHTQIKDHEVDPGELKASVEYFQQLDSAHVSVYQRFTLACPTLSTTLRSVETGLARLRGAKPFYEDVPSALGATRQDLLDRLTKVGLQDYAELIESKVFIDVGHESMCHDDRALELFVARMLKRPSYASKLWAMVEPAFAQMMRALGSSRGTVLDRATLEAMLATAVSRGETGEKGIVVAVQNWTSESFDPPPDYSLDWSKLFERTPRRVPEPKTWDEQLVPELRLLHKQILAERKERQIRFRGKCALSTGLAIGATFPSVGGWVFDIPQPPSKENWRSDATPTASYNLGVEIMEGDSKGTDIVLGLNVKGDGRKDVVQYIESTGALPRLFAFMSPPSQGGQAIGGAEEAIAFASHVRDALGELLKTRGLRRTRLFFYGPFALAVFVGQLLTAVGEVQLFEYLDPGYAPSCNLQT